jgi:predicted N-acyltransferase
VAGAFNLIGRDTLYGRNWGSDGAYRFLHFEACYYQAIEFAIERGLSRVEAGAQGEHKIGRGYLPVETRSYHYIDDPHFAAAVADFLRREKRAIEAERAALSEYSPFKQTQD